MPITINPLSAPTANNHSSAVVAREFLKEVAAYLINKDGTVKSGYLRVNGNNSWSAGHMGSGATNATNTLLARVQDAYGHEVKEALQSYLSNTSAKNGSAGKIGTQSFVALIQKMEQSAAQNSMSSPDESTGKILGAQLGHHRLNTSGLIPQNVIRAILNQPNQQEVPPAPGLNELQITSPSAAAPSPLPEQEQPMLEAVELPPVDMASENRMERASASLPASAAEVLAKLRQLEPQTARQLIAEQFDNAANLPAKNSTAPQPGHINHVTDTALLASKPDLSNSVTLLDLNADPVNLSGMNLQGARLLIRPRFDDFKEKGQHWGVDLSDAHLENTHIELDLSTGLREKIDSGAIQTENLSKGLLINDDYFTPKVGQGVGGIVGMIASIPPHFPELRVALTGQLLDFLNQHPSQSAEDKVHGWPASALSVVALVDQFPELQNNQEITAAAKRFASGVSKEAHLTDIVLEIKDRAHPSPLLVQCGLDRALAVTPDARKDFFMTYSERINRLFDFAERLDDSHPDAMEIKRLASLLEQTYLTTEPFASLSQPFSYDDEKVRVLVSFDKKSKETSALVIPQAQFQNMMLNPSEVRWDMLAASRFHDKDQLPPRFLDAKSMRSALPSLVNNFPIVKSAFLAASTNGASRSISELFQDNPEVKDMMTSFIDRGVVKETQMGPDEVSDFFSLALAPLYEDFQSVNDFERWPEARFTTQHLKQLLALAKKEGLGNNKMAFARYLFVLSTTLLKMSSYKGYGSDSVSVTSLRFYAHTLLAEAGRLAPELTVRNDNYKNLQEFEKGVRNVFACAELLSDEMKNGAIKHMPYSSLLVFPKNMATRNLANIRNENSDLPDEAVY